MNPEPTRRAYATAIGDLNQHDSAVDHQGSAADFVPIRPFLNGVLSTEFVSPCRQIALFAVDPKSITK